MIKPRRRPTGQILPLVLLTTLLLAGAAVYTLYTGELLAKKLQTQIAADAVALSVCRVQGKALNQIAVLNQGIDWLTNQSHLVLATWTTLAACASLCTFGVGCHCVPKLARFSLRAPKLLQQMQGLAKKMATAQQRIADANPTLASLAAAQVAGANHVGSLRRHYPEKSIVDEGPKLWVDRDGEKDLANQTTCHSTGPLIGSREGKTSCANAADLLQGPFAIPGLMRLAADFANRQQFAVAVKHDYRQNIVAAGSRQLIQKVFRPGHAVRPEAHLEQTSIEAVAQAKPLGKDGTMDTKLMQPHWDAQLVPVSEFNHLTEFQYALDGRNLLH